MFITCRDCFHKFRTKTCDGYTCPNCKATVKLRPEKTMSLDEDPSVFAESGTCNHPPGYRCTYCPSDPKEIKITPMDETEAILSDRQSTHGDFALNARISQDIRAAFHSPEHRWVQLNPSQREALDSIAIKIGRILAGDPNFPDHWADIEGYARLARLSCPSSPESEPK